MIKVSRRQVDRALRIEINIDRFHSEHQRANEKCKTAGQQLIEIRLPATVRLQPAAFGNGQIVEDASVAAGVIGVMGCVSDGWWTAR